MKLGGLLALTFLVLMLFATTPINANQQDLAFKEPCGGYASDYQVHAYSNPKLLSTYLWGSNKAKIIEQYPETKPDESKSTSPILLSLIEGNTEFAIDLTTQFQFGISGAANNLPFEPYGVHWSPVVYGSFAEGLMQRGASIKQVYGCLHDEYGFDDQFVEASINYAHSKAGTYYYCAFWRTRYPDSPNMPVGGSCLDPAIYGKNPYVIQIKEPTWMFGPDQHVSSFDVWAVCATQTKFQQQPGQQCISEDSYLEQHLRLDMLFGGGYTMLVVPEDVVQQVGLDNVKRADALYTIATYEITPISLVHPSVRQFGQDDLAKMQDSYRQLHDALKTYGQQKGYDFDTLTRIPIDTRLDSLTAEIVWNSFPDPVQELTDGYASSSFSLQHWGLNRTEMASKYSRRVLSYLTETGMFSQQQRTDMISKWLEKWIGPDLIAQIPRSQIRQQGSFLYMNYKQALQAFHAWQEGSSKPDSRSPSSFVADPATAPAFTDPPPAKPTVSISGDVQVEDFYNSTGSPMEQPQPSPLPGAIVQSSMGLGITGGFVKAGNDYRRARRRRINLRGYNALLNNRPPLLNETLSQLAETNSLSTSN